MDTHVLHGYSMHELQEIARITVLSNRHRLSTWDFASATDTAWEGVVEALLASEERPERHELMYAAWNAVKLEMRQAGQMHGRDERHGGTSRSFNRYWQTLDITPSPEGVVEPLALRQIWGKLSDSDRQVLKVHALADCDRRAGADMLGLEVRQYEGKLRRAREKFKRYWFEGETPRPMSPKAVRKPGAGNFRDSENASVAA